jgi:hypothetical protein
MYACIPEIGRPFFEGVCAPSDTTAYFCDSPPLAVDSRIDQRSHAVVLSRSVFTQDEGYRLPRRPLPRIPVNTSKTKLWARV